MFISRRNAISIICHRGLSYIGIGVVSGTLLNFATNKSFNSSQQSSSMRLNLLEESGSFLEEVNRLRRLAIPKDSNLYQAPNLDELNRFSHLAEALAIEDISTALDQAADLHYEVVRFSDRSTRQVFYGLREQQGQHMRGWGSYFINLTYRTRALLEAPHVVFDRFSDEIAAEAFLTSSAYGFLLAGAHRHANGFNTADVCQHISSIFHIVHQTWMSSQIKTWQIHSFDASTPSSFPNGTDCVLSNGRGEISPEVLDFDQRLEANGFQSYVYHWLSANAVESQQVNQSVPGDRFRALGATHNIQGIYCRQIDAAFTHVELSTQVRVQASTRSQVAQIIAESIQATA